MEWKVYVGDFNSKTIREHNVFDHCGVMDDIRKAAKKHGDDREKFEEEVRRTLLYHYWSKCEWEIIIDHWPPLKDREAAIKVDVYDQIMMNRNIFMDYVWEHLGELCKSKKRSK